jgi:hypothetical protein
VSRRFGGIKTAQYEKGILSFFYGKEKKIVDWEQDF